MGSLLTESYGKAVLDSACTATVSGMSWIQNYIDQLPAQYSNLVSHTDIRTNVIFGSGNRVAITRKWFLPVIIGNINCFLGVLEVPGTLPLLLSVNSMRKARLSIDFDKNVVSIGGIKQSLHVASTGHIMMDISLPKEESCMMVSDLTESKIMKLHCQFGHCSANKLFQLIRNTGGTVTSRNIDEVVRNCEICCRFGRGIAKPAVSLPLACRPNELVALDLHQMRNFHSTWYLHVIDLYSRYSEAILIYNKLPKTIIEGFLQSWCLRHGFPTAVLTDNGGEFCNKEFVSFAENYDISIKTTAAFSPWSNGINERHNAIVTDMYEKLMADDRINVRN